MKDQVKHTAQNMAAKIIQFSILLPFLSAKNILADLKETSYELATHQSVDINKLCQNKVCIFTNVAME